MRGVWLIARADVTFQLKERSTLVWMFVMPLLFFYFIGTVTGGFAVRGGTGARPLALAAADGGEPLLGALVQHLEANGFSVQAAGEGATASRRLSVPARFDALLADGDPVTLTLTLPEPGLGAQLDQWRVTRAAYTVLAQLAALEAQGQTPTEAALDALADQPRALQLTVESAGPRRHVPTGFEQAIPGTLVMFTLLILLTSGAVQLVIERERGQLSRLASAPLTRSQIVWGKWAGKLGLGLVQVAFAVAAGTWLFGMDWGPDLPAVALVLAGWAAFCASLALLLGALARTQAQAAGIGTLASLALAALGGAWWPIEVMPAFMQGLQAFLPSGWTMDAIHRLVSFEAGAASALPHALALYAGTLLVGWVAARRFRFQ